MPLERSDAILDLSDPHLILGPHKHRPTERLHENGDPLACKKKRKVNVSPPGDAGISVSNACADSADKGKHISSPVLPPTQLAHIAPNPSQATNHTERSNLGTSNGAWAIVVDDSDEDEIDERSDGGVTEEDDDAELGMCSIILVDICPSAD
jgi:hypothetical protein